MYRSMNLKGFLLILGVMLLIFLILHSALRGTVNEKAEEEKILRVKKTKLEEEFKRLNKELKRRSKVIGVFPNEDSVLRLMGSVLIELHDAMLAGRAIFSKDSLAALMESDVPAKLVVIAGEQQQLRAA